MSDPRAPIDDLQQLAERIRGIEARLDRLATPSGSNLARTVEELDTTVTLLTQFANDAERDQVDTFALTTTETVRAEEVFTAPNYPCRALFIVLGMAGGTNSTGAADNLQARVRAVLASTTGESQRAITTVASTASGFLAPTYTFDRTLDPLETVTFQTTVWTQVAGWASSAGNRAQVSYAAILAPIV